MNGWCGEFSFNQQPSVRLKLTWDITNAVSPWQISLSAGQLGLCWGLDDPLLLRAIKLWVWDPRPAWIVCLWYSANIVRNWKQTCKQPQTKNNPQCSPRRISRAVLRLTCLTEAPSRPEVESDLISEAGGVSTFTKMFYPCESFLQVSLGHWIIQKGENDLSPSFYLKSGSVGSGVQRPPPVSGESTHQPPTN